VYHSELLEDWLSVWHRSAGGGWPRLGRIYTVYEQAERETAVDRALNNFETASLDWIVAAGARLACVALDIEDHQTESLLREDFWTVALDLASQARHLDSSVSAGDILQACRNAWTACGLEALLGEPPRLTPPVFAYSMLYPYSDNYLDNPNISYEAKLRFSARFRLRLSGDLVPIDALENIVWKFVSLIEGHWPRQSYPAVYDALLAIHEAQEKSLEQQRCASDILRLSFAKGGASVLADAFLAKGSLLEAEQRFAFGWGVLLQLGDDLQDLANDCERGSHTLFSTAAAKGTLDNLTTQTLRFASAVIESLETLPNGAEHLKELLQKNSISLLITAAGEYSDFYSTDYLYELERYSPLRFSFLKSRKQRAAHWLDAGRMEQLLCYSLSRRSAG
jgi:hypothetical protein